MSCEICHSWVRDTRNCYPKLKSVSCHFVMTDHHVDCPHYNDSLIDVWKVEHDGESFYTNEKPCIEDFENGEVITQEKMHKEVLEQLPEFNGF